MGCDGVRILTIAEALSSGMFRGQADNTLDEVGMYGLLENNEENGEMASISNTSPSSQTPNLPLLPCQKILRHSAGQKYLKYKFILQALVF